MPEPADASRRRRAGHPLSCLQHDPPVDEPRRLELARDRRDERPRTATSSGVHARGTIDLFERDRELFDERASLVGELADLRDVRIDYPRG